MDRRLRPFSGRVALISLKDELVAPYTEGEAAQVITPLADIYDKPGGMRERQLLLGSAVTIVDRDRGHVFCQAQRDGYCGWLKDTAVGKGPEPTHWVVAPSAHLYAEPVVQSQERAGISLGSRLAVTGSWGAWAGTPHGFVPLTHIRPLGQWAPDPVSVAESLLGTPYLWGGNSRFGVDCSGLVQISMHACGKDCPGDSDMQMQIGRGLNPEDPLLRGDLIFWKGHVAMVVNPEVLIHANGSTMSVAYEGIRDAVNRISVGGGGLVQSRQRV
jgi:cell wall-associated NlpC family hydrolase